MINKSMDTFKPTWLYLKQHNVTGLKYFGKTIRDVENYNGSGIHWTRHLNKHGADITTVWKQLFTDKIELNEYALKYSTDNNIVESKEYANLKPEDGLMGGDTGITDEGREKLRIASSNRIHSPETKEKIKSARAKQSPTMLGKTHTEETKEKIRQKRALQITSEETRNKISASNKGKQHSQEAKDKIAAGNKGKIRSKETLLKMSNATKNAARRTCNKCNVTCSISNFARWHSDCKEKDHF